MATEILLQLRAKEQAWPCTFLFHGIHWIHTCVRGSRADEGKYQNPWLSEDMNGRTA